jgi:lipopolysaccharide transport system ATP-binding protein
MSTVIKIENLYKEYRLGVIGHGTLYRDLQSWWAKLRGKEDPNSLIGHESNNTIKDQILALNNINLEVNNGDALGIIGANGAGKSTLLKILSRVTAPTSGTIKVKGRIASLLEVGTGFHKELTGRENIYLNGAINGMNRYEVNKKLDDIVDFAGVAQFIDTPVKRYSSGMYVRLGFSVAAHLEPDILVVDEVLAVGDARFQKKAIGKMQDVSKENGRTVLFVSHNMASIQALCRKAILLENGKVTYEGNSEDVVNYYIQKSNEDLRACAVIDSNARGLTGNKRVFQSLRILNQSGEEVSSFKLGDEIIFEITMDSRGREVKAPLMTLYVIDALNRNICEFSSDSMVKGEFVIDGSTIVRIVWKSCWLMPGNYHLRLALQSYTERIDRVNPESSPRFAILESDIYNTGGLDRKYKKRGCIFLPDGRWEIDQIKD